MMEKHRIIRIWSILNHPYRITKIMCHTEQSGENTIVDLNLTEGYYGKRKLVVDIDKVFEL